MRRVGVADSRFAQMITSPIAKARSALHPLTESGKGVRGQRRVSVPTRVPAAGRHALGGLMPISEAMRASSSSSETP